MQFQKMIVRVVLLIGIINISIMAKDYVLLVGVGEFKSSKLFKPLNVSNDIESIKKSLIENKLTKDYKIIELINAKATKNNILSTFRDIANRATQNDRVFFYYTGHGTAHADSSIWKYLRKLNRDERNFLENTSAIIPFDFDENNIHNSMIVGSEDFIPILEILDKNSSGIIMLDACFSSLMARGEKFKSNFIGNKKKNYKNITIISNSNRTSSRSNNSGMTGIVSKCFKKKKYKKCIKSSRNSDAIYLK